MSEAIWSSTAPVTNTIRSRSKREKMSKLRSPRFDCSMTMGTSALSGSGILSCMRLFLLFIVVLPLHRVHCARLQEDSWHAALFSERKAFRTSETVTPPGARCAFCHIDRKKVVQGKSVSVREAQ